jgi:hypothetical protein
MLGMRLWICSSSPPAQFECTYSSLAEAEANQRNVTSYRAHLVPFKKLCSASLLSEEHTFVGKFTLSTREEESVDSNDGQRCFGSTQVQLESTQHYLV